MTEKLLNELTAWARTQPEIIALYLFWLMLTGRRIANHNRNYSGYHTHDRRRLTDDRRKLSG